MTILERSAAYDALWAAQGKRCAVIGHPLRLAQAIPLGGTRIGNIVAGALGGLLVDKDVFLSLNTPSQSTRPVELVSLPSNPLDQDFLARGVAVWYSVLMFGRGSRSDQERCLSLLFWTWQELQAHSTPLGNWSMASGSLTYAPYPLEEIQRRAGDLGLSWHWNDSSSQGIRLGLWPRSLTVFFRSQHQCLESLRPCEPGADDLEVVLSIEREVNVLEGLFTDPGAALVTLRTLHPFIIGEDLPWHVLGSLSNTQGLKEAMMAGDLDRIEGLQRPWGQFPSRKGSELVSTLFGYFQSRSDAIENGERFYRTLPNLVARGRWLPFELRPHEGQLSFWLDFILDHGLPEEAALSAAAGVLLGAAEAAVDMRLPGDRQTVIAMGLEVRIDHMWREIGRSTWISINMA